ncbi:MAG TPA: D-alanyl-D-alanine carboxypeptidase family protein [Thermodesulfobacteriota bacterium]|nr:D-alanyl-D-alanine carboxypeptidase family protein [Thermodesulfobacteriota bacterium]
MIRSFRNGWIPVLLLVTLILIFPEGSFAKRERPTKKPETAQMTKKSTPTENPPTAQAALQGAQSSLQCDSQSALLMDGLTGEILFEQNPRLRIPPASFVKVMTLYLAFDAIHGGQLKMDDLVTVSEKAWRTQGSKMFIKVGSQVKVEDLLKGIAVASGNDACIALAEHMAGSEEVFVSKMNEKAKLLGMNDSQFRNSDGMPAEGQYTSALDMAILARRYIENHPEALAIHSMIEYEYNGIKQGNRNVLLTRNIGVDGLKTGHIEESGYHLAATAKRDGQRMIAVVMGCDKVKKRAPEAQKLLEYGFRNFSTVEAVKKGATFGPVKVRRGKVDQVSLTASEDVRVTVGKGKENMVSVTPEFPPSVVAPIKKGQVVAKAIVQNEGKKIREVGLLASSDVEKTLIPPWPVLAAIILGLCLVGAAFWWVRRTRAKKYA